MRGFVPEMRNHAGRPHLESTICAEFSTAQLARRTVDRLLLYANTRMPQARRPMMILIDDNDLFRTALAANLREDGYEVQEFSAPSAVAPERLNDVQAAIIGCTMGLDEGLPLAQRFHAFWPKVPVIVLTRPWPDPKVKTPQPDYVTVLPKPLDYEALATVLRQRLKPG
jgi:DNA-binding NtrC family response regulator